MAHAAVAHKVPGADSEDEARDALRAAVRRAREAGLTVAALGSAGDLTRAALHRPSSEGT
ncbi:hypothetical protein ACH4F6_34395 [Streptomyces sp. NPDC017936]|uniref:hypothetical protein n=1 Tax=Streptomyces sp. NPDC017936 TaxID=3365016 RepID=UPI003791276D